MVDPLNTLILTCVIVVAIGFIAYLVGMYICPTHYALYQNKNGHHFTNWSAQ